MSWMPSRPKPESGLGYHRILSPLAGVRVSPLCLGAMNFGDSWKSFLGECNKETSFGLLDYFFENGGNFIDTANNYQNEESEKWLGEWMVSRKNRNQIVLATKFTTSFRMKGFGATEHLTSNMQGNHSKSLKVSVDESLAKLQTSYIDLLYVHWWDFTTSIEELMRSLNHLVAAGKVLYLGISDTPAWIVVKCNEFARQHGLTPFSVYQGHWSCAFRDMEREIIPMCQSEGLAIAPWGALGRGLFKTTEEAQSGEGRKMGGATDKTRAIAAKLGELAKQKNTQVTSIALAYVMHKTPYVFPIIGGRKLEHLKSNIEALSVRLTDAEIDEIEAADDFDIGFPMSFLFEGPGQKYSNRMTSSDIKLLAANWPIDTVPKVKPITPRQDL